MARQATQQAVAEAVGLDEAKAAAGAPPGGSGSQDPFVGELRRAGLLPLLVLRLLADGPSYGGRLMERVTAATGGLLAVNPNTMYPLLRRLEADGLIEGSWEHPERRSRRFYARTAAGAAEAERLEAAVRPRLTAIADAVAALQEELGWGG